jgi:hypothetical protein
VVALEAGPIPAVKGTRSPPEASSIIDTVKRAAPQGDLLDNRFDEALALANTGGANVSANRRTELNLRFSF